MARKARYTPAGIPQYGIQQGNNRQVCFGSEWDFKAYLSWLKYLPDFGPRFWQVRLSLLHTRVENAVYSEVSVISFCN